jgi:hypothetical protein
VTRLWLSNRSGTLLGMVGIALNAYWIAIIGHDLYQWLT